MTDRAAFALPSFDAIVLAGGRGSRLNGIDKASIVLAGERLVDRAVGAATEAGAGRVIVAGPEHTASRYAVVVREDPPYGGPLAGVAAALPLVRAPWVLLLACDLEHPGLVCEQLMAGFENLSQTEASLGHEIDGFVLRDAGGQPQWLASLHRTSTLRRGLEALDGAFTDRPLRLLFAQSRLVEVDATDRVVADIDLPEDLQRIEKEHP